MSIHIGARPEEFAPTVLIPGDPLRTKWIASTFLNNAVRYTAVRNISENANLRDGIIAQSACTDASTNQSRLATVSDRLVTGEEPGSRKRQQTFSDTFVLALSTAKSAA